MKREPPKVAIARAVSLGDHARSVLPGAPAAVTATEAAGSAGRAVVTPARISRPPIMVTVRCSPSRITAPATLTAGSRYRSRLPPAWLGADAQAAGGPDESMVKTGIADNIPAAGATRPVLRPCHELVVNDAETGTGPGAWRAVLHPAYGSRLHTIGRSLAMWNDNSAQVRLFRLLDWPIRFRCRLEWLTASGVHGGHALSRLRVGTGQTAGQL